jgi:hypothetical protein
MAGAPTGMIKGHIPGLGARGQLYQVPTLCYVEELFGVAGTARRSIEWGKVLE